MVQQVAQSVSGLMLLPVDLQLELSHLSLLEHLMHSESFVTVKSTRMILTYCLNSFEAKYKMVISCKREIHSNINVDNVCRDNSNFYQVIIGLEQSHDALLSVFNTELTVSHDCLT